MLDKYPTQVKLVIKHFPLDQHKYAFEAAQAALAADRQGKYWEFHHALFKNQKTLDSQKINAIALELGLDMAAFEKDRRDPSIKAIIHADRANGRSIQVEGTPAIYMNGKELRARSLDQFSKAIDAELQKLGKK